MNVTQNVYKADSVTQPQHRWETSRSVINYCVNLIVLVAVTKTTNQWLIEGPVACRPMALI
jgi:hypothetical protein